MKLIITGSNGQLGKELQTILRKGFSEIGPIAEEYRNCTVLTADIEDLDITDSRQTALFIEREKPDVVINCAAMTNVDMCEVERDTAYRANALGPANLAKACERTGAKLCHISTDYVFSGEGNVPFSEYDLCHPKSIYGSTKYMGEVYVREFCSRYFVLRTAWLYGYEGGNFVKTIRRLAAENKTIKVVRDQVGNPTNANDLAYHILKVIRTEEYGIYHCTGNGICSWFDFAKEIVSLSGLDCAVQPCTTEEFPRPARRPAYSALEHRMLRCTVGDEMRPWEDALRQYIHTLDKGGA